MEYKNMESSQECLQQSNNDRDTAKLNKSQLEIPVPSIKTVEIPYERLNEDDCLSKKKQEDFFSETFQKSNEIENYEKYMIEAIKIGSGCVFLLGFVTVMTNVFFVLTGKLVEMYASDNAEAISFSALMLFYAFEYSAWILVLLKTTKMVKDNPYGKNINGMVSLALLFKILIDLYSMWVDTAITSSYSDGLNKLLMAPFKNVTA
ncbi:hypothetical protein EDEG_02117 [Edhazardia aedis USNM 41457]|uniref:Uncharacterized protein n=1 Tax=Edhazardia aedis (strain USNM 41457) TaxID=1003232 RepID=J8ZV37_EDHAE|nr:hypothetical protein EDEG_02117 [Edhazardia aedis USNM 41457]|eukprot:EJW03533.1 hypothetical protein EDEG_02117 [Edhazardia aedis USNM 41457]